MWLIVLSDQLLIIASLLTVLNLCMIDEPLMEALLLHDLILKCMWHSRR